MNTRYLYIALFILFILGCDEETPITENEELIFINSFPIEVPAYQYTASGGQIIEVRGDSSYQSNWQDTLTHTPVLAWGTSGLPLLSVAIFTEPIQVSGGVILSENVVWKWHSGMDAAIPDRVQYLEGASVTNGIEREGSPAPLPPGRYFWGIWAWNSSGTRVLYSSRELEFYVPD
jgi:hypothetical protein